MKRVIQLLLVLCVFVLAGCKENKERYLSITTSGYDKKGNLMVNIYKYSISKKRLKRRFSKKYTSQYPLGVYSQSKNTVYYTAEYEDGSGDQLYAYNLDTKKSKKLTNSLTAINQIIPVDNKVYMIGVEKGQRSLKPYYYNLETEKFNKIKANGDLNFDNMVYDVFHHNIYLSADYQSEEDKALEEANAGKGSKYIAPNTYIYSLKDNSLQRIYSTNRKLVYRMLPEKNGDLCFTECESIPAWNPEYFTYTLDMKTNKKKPAIDIDGIMDVTQFAYYTSAHQIVFLGSKSDDSKHSHRGIYLYDVDSGSIELLFETEDEYINNFVLLE